MLPTDAAMDHGAKCNAIQNALQKVEVCLSFKQAAMVLNELHKELLITFMLRRKEKGSPAKLPTTHVETSGITPQPQGEIIPCGRTENCGYFASLQCDGTDKSFCYATE